MKLLVLGILICQSIFLRMVNCETISNEDERVKEINGQPASNVTLENIQEAHNKTSISYTNTTIVAVTEPSSIFQQTANQKRSLLKIHSLLHGVKRSFKKALFAWTYYGPELGLCGCLFKFAWFEYPIVSEMSYTAMGRARRMVNNFMSDFMDGWKEDRAHAQYRIGNEVATLSEDYDYQNSDINTVYGPNRRFSEIIKKPQENILVQKMDPKLIGVVDMLKKLEPKTNLSLKNDVKPTVETQGWKTMQHPQNILASPFMNRSSPDQYLRKPSGVLPIVVADRTTSGKRELRNMKEEKRNYNQFTVVKNNVPPPFPIQKNNPAIKIDRIGYAPSNLPKLQDLPPADYTFMKNGVYHHIHDLRKNKIPLHSKKTEWISADFADTIMSLLGLTHPGRSVKHSATKCTKIYALQFVLRFIRSAFVG